MIKVENLKKEYHGIEAVHGVSFTADTGAVLGLLGPNGAGKTTIMKVLTGYHFPSSGNATIDGIDVTENPLAVKRRVGYLPETVPLYQELTVMEYLNFAADARSLKGEARKAAIEKSVSSCGLGGYLHKRVDELSKGYKQRLGLAQAILHDPPILILDEPTTGLDPNQIIEIRSLIRSLGERKTVILSTHILQEVEAICSKVIILNEGQIAAQGEPKHIGETLKGEERIKLRLKSTSGTLNAQQVSTSMQQLPGILGVAMAGQETGEYINCMVTFSSRRDENRRNIETGEMIFDWAVTNRIKLLEMEIQRLSLEEIFVKLTSEGETK